MYERIPLTPALVASGTATTHAGVSIDGYDAMAFEFIVDTAGATPTVTWKVQAAPDDNSISDANAHWYDIAYVTDASDTTATATRTATSAGGQIEFLANPVARQYRRFRVVTSSNTNVAYHAYGYRIN